MIYQKFLFGVLMFLFLSSFRFMFILIIIHISFSNLYSDDNVNSDSLKLFHMQQLNIIEKRTALFDVTPGSAHHISSEFLTTIKSVANDEALQKVPGLNVVDEEGLGLRLNLGIRGLDPDRSRTLLVMEDGMPLALAPYGEPEMYYTPNIDRMKEIEILKGSGSILYGPQTIGGVVNFITPDPPVDSKYNLNLAGGNGGFLKSKIGYGSSTSQFGFMAEYMRKQGDNFGPTNFAINDLMTKFKVVLGGSSNLYFKLGVYDESSNSTYVGITQTMYDDGDFYTILAPNDNLKIRRYSASVSHNYAASDNLLINTIIYGYTTSRNWLRQDFSRSPIQNAENIFGDTSVKNGALYMKNSTAQRNRQFEVFGIEPRLTYQYNAIGMNNEMKAGIRFLYERAFEQLIVGNKSEALSGQLRDDEIRTGKAFSAYIQNRSYISENIIITPGIRLENFNYDREIMRAKSVDTLISANNSINAIIPGLGINYNPYSNLTLFAGIHRGFAPPRTKDAITSEGVALDLEAEKSWNSEIGIRSEIIDGINLEMTAYYLDFSNQIIPVSMSSGGTGTGLVNGGATIHMGLEGAITVKLSQLLNTDFGIAFHTNASFNRAEYTSDRFIQSGEATINIKGYALPYAPEFKLSGLMSFSTNWGLILYAGANYTGRQYTDELNTVEPSPDGQIGLINPIFTLDFTAQYKPLESFFGLFVSVKNLMDERYISSRRPQGIKVGMPRIITAGVDFSI